MVAECLRVCVFWSALLLPRRSLGALGGADFLRNVFRRLMSARRQVGILNWTRPLTLTLDLLGESPVDLCAV